VNVLGISRTSVRMTLICGTKLKPCLGYADDELKSPNPDAFLSELRQKDPRFTTKSSVFFVPATIQSQLRPEPTGFRS
jgi:hypothetical protein